MRVWTLLRQPSIQGDFQRQNLLRDFIGRCYIPGGDAATHKAARVGFIGSGFMEDLGLGCSRVHYRVLGFSGFIGVV